MALKTQIIALWILVALTGGSYLHHRLTTRIISSYLYVCFENERMIIPEKNVREKCNDSLYKLYLERKYEPQ